MCTLGGHRVSDHRLTLAHWEPGTHHLTSQGIHVSLAHTRSHLETPCSPSLSCMALQDSLPPIAFLGSLSLIRVIETGPPETKELLNCYPLAHLKDHLIKPLCVYA